MIFEDIEIAIKKSNRKTVSIFVERDGSVSARVPQSLSDDEIQAVLKRKTYQIFKNIAEWEQLNFKKTNREYVNGQSFMYLGRNYRLKISEDAPKKLSLKNGYFILSDALKHKAKELFIEFYKEKLNEKIPPIILKYKDQLDVQPNEIKIMELQNRWASCTMKGNVNFHWKCAMAPIDVLNYIVAHELTHLIHPNHTQDFWNELDKIKPNYLGHIEWLKQNGAGMDL